MGNNNIRKVFLDGCPTKSGFGNNKDKILTDWKEICNKNFLIYFVYDDIEGYFIPIKYTTKGQKLTFKYNDNIYEIATSQLLLGRLGGILGTHTKQFRYNIGDVIYCNGKGQIINRYRKGRDKNSEKFYKIKCLECNNEYERSESHLADKERGVKCPICSDGISYGEKFFADVLKQLKLKFKTQLSNLDFNWCGKRRYDFYFNYNGEDYITEIHGIQHYIQSDRGRTLKEEQENDKLKKQIALENGIKEENYIVIDCRKSEMEWIKDNIYKSKLNKIFDLSKVDWLEAEEFTFNSKLIQVCKLYQSNQYNIVRTISEEVNLSMSTVRNYLNKGKKLGLCDYDSKEIIRLNANHRNKKRTKRVLVFNGNGDELGSYESATKIEEISEQKFGVKLSQGKISLVCNGKRKHHKGFIFKYEKEVA